MDAKGGGDVLAVMMFFKPDIDSGLGKRAHACVMKGGAMMDDTGEKDIYRIRVSLQHPYRFCLGSHSSLSRPHY